MSVTESEYTVLRQTIASRGTARMILFPATIVGWAFAARTFGVAASPLGSLFSLAVLAAGFEAIHALHVGVERIGRYLQTFYEGAENGPKWETTAMSVGPALPGGGVDPLFTVMFVLVTLLNAMPLAVARPTTLELIAVGALHAALLVRLARARGAAARQRAVELESYRAIKSRLSGGKD